MATWYVDNRATGANNGTSPANAWTSIAAVVGASINAGDTIVFVAGSGPYRENFDLKKNGAVGNPIVWNLNGCEVSAAIDATSAAYEWRQSALGTNEWYLTLVGGGNPFSAQVKSVTVDGNYWIQSAEAAHQMGTVGTLTNKKAAWGNNDSLAFSTLYVRYDTGNPSTSGAKIYASNRNYVLDTNWGHHTIRGGHLSFGNEACVRARGAGWTIERCVIRHPNLTGIQMNTAGATCTINNCIGYWAGHRFVSLEADATMVVQNCTDWGAHIFALIGPAVTGAGSMTIKNCISANGEAGAIDKQSAAAVLDEDYNLWYPRMTAAGGALGYLRTAIWTTTGNNDIPANTLTTINNQNLLSNPLFLSVNDVDFSLCNFRLSSSSPCIDKGVSIPGVNYDVDGFPRISGFAADIGAYEFRQPVCSGVSVSVGVFV